MRTLKFRAWDREEGRFYHEPIGMFNSLPSNWEKFYDIQQFTGLLDKQGKEIYEGDIVKFKWNRKYWTGEVAWGTCGFWVVRWLHILEWAENKEVEVIGNIYENKELLNDNSN